jgi:hypothetical protein
VLGEQPGQGFYQMMDGIEVGRVNVAAHATAPAGQWAALRRACLAMTSCWIWLADAGTGDIPAKVDGRARRQGILLDQTKQFTILMTEAALRWRPRPAALQVQQLAQIAAVMRLPNVSIGILPLRGQARILYPEGFPGLRRPRRRCRHPGPRRTGP